MDMLPASLYNNLRVDNMSPSRVARFSALRRCPWTSSLASLPCLPLFAPLLKGIGKQALTFAGDPPGIPISILRTFWCLLAMSKVTGDSTNFLEPAANRAMVF